jgi:hypothetical protein
LSIQKKFCVLRTIAEKILYNTLYRLLLQNASERPRCQSISCVQGALYVQPRFIQNVGVDHRGRDVLVAQKLLNSPDVIVRFKKVGSEGVAKGGLVDSQ